MIFNIKFSIIFTSKFLLYFYICLDKQKQITMSINKVSIVGIKGFKGSGKDTVASIIFPVNSIVFFLNDAAKLQFFRNMRRIFGCFFLLFLCRREFFF